MTGPDGKILYCVQITCIHMGDGMEKIMQQVFQVQPVDVCRLTAMTAVIIMDDSAAIFAGYRFFLA